MWKGKRRVRAPNTHEYEEVRAGLRTGKLCKKQTQNLKKSPAPTALEVKVLLSQQTFRTSTVSQSQGKYCTMLHRSKVCKKYNALEFTIIFTQSPYPTERIRIQISSFHSTSLSPASITLKLCQRFQEMPIMWKHW